MEVENLHNFNLVYPAVPAPDTGVTAVKYKESAAVDGSKAGADDRAVTHTGDIPDEDDPKFASAVREAVDKANKALAFQTTTRRLSYSVHEKTHKVIVSVINTDTNEVIREIPPKSVLDSYAKMLEFAGLIVDERS